MFENFVNKYQLQKTLRFELRPVGETLKHIEAKGLIKQDQERARSYKEMKKTIDAFHRDFIELSLAQVKLTNLDEYYLLYNENSEVKKDDKFKKKFSEVQKELRKEVVKGFTSEKTKEIFSKIDKKELISEKLEDWIKSKNDSSLYFDSNFKTFTTYFSGFHENRMNMYSQEEQSTAISYRLINENLPKFVDNLKIFIDVKEKLGLSAIQDIENELHILTNNKKLEEIFQLNFFNETLTQKQIEFYNAVIGGYYIDDRKVKVKGINEHINLYNQKQEKKSNRIPKLKLLYKQILSDREGVSLIGEAFEEDQEVLDAIENYYKNCLIQFKNNDKEENILEKIKELLGSIRSFDLNKIYIRNDTNLTNISGQLFGDYFVFSEALNFYYENIINSNYHIDYLSEKKREKLEKNKEKYTKQTYIPVALLQTCINKYFESLDKEHSYLINYTSTCVADYFINFFQAKKKEESEKEYDLISKIKTKYSCIQGLLNSDYPKDKMLHQEKKTVGDIKEFLDSLMEFLHFIKPLSLENESLLEKDEIFYSSFEEYYKQVGLLIPLYNKVRNYVTKKPYSLKKIKLNFENRSKFLDGWVDSYTDKSDNATQAGAYLFRKKNLVNEFDYFVGFSSDVKLFRCHLQDKILSKDKSEYERLDYYQLNTKSLYNNCYKGSSYEEDRQKLFDLIYDFARKNSFRSLLNEFDKYINNLKDNNKPTPSGLINIISKFDNNVYNKLLVDPEFKKINHEVMNNLTNTLLSLDRIDITKRYEDYKFETFIDVMKIIDELATQKIFKFFYVSKKELENAIYRDNKPLLLFRVCNKDLTFYDSYVEGRRKLKNRGIDNLHTMYLKALFNDNQETYDLGTGAIFYREKSISYESSVFEIGHHSEILKDKFSYPIVSNRRFAHDKFIFHISISQNYKSSKYSHKVFNIEVCKQLQLRNSNINIIGLDRGERNLIYLTLIDQSGKIIKQKSLNSIINDKYQIETSYHKLLDKRESERAQARESWGVIQSIKELKEGYLSQVVHEISKLMFEHNAIVVMEDLNFGFKRGRFKVEKQVYQKLEKMLINKLNYLVFKDRKPDELGGLYNALQLTSKFESFKKLGKQCGFLFYVPAWNTSKIDPMTGFVNLFNLRYENIEKSQEFFNRFDSIKFNVDQNYFEFHFDYKNFSTKVVCEESRWVVCSTNHDRYVWDKKLNKGKGDQKLINVNQELKDLFSKHNIDFESGLDLRQVIASCTKSDFYQKLLFSFNVLMMIRYNNGKNESEEQDYILSPVFPFFNSLVTDSTRPQNADANGAYHIALKGLFLLNKIKSSNQDNLSKLDLSISNKEWIDFSKQMSHECN